MRITALFLVVLLAGCAGQMDQFAAQMDQTANTIEATAEVADRAIEAARNANDTAGEAVNRMAGALQDVEVRAARAEGVARLALDKASQTKAGRVIQRVVEKAPEQLADLQGVVDRNNATLNSLDGRLESYGAEAAAAIRGAQETAERLAEAKRQIDALLAANRAAGDPTTTGAAAGGGVALVLGILAILYRAVFKKEK